MNSNGISLSDPRTPEGMRIYAIGDVHGCADHLARLHALIEQEIARDPPTDWRIIHVGDYSDRGPNTKRVLDLILERSHDNRVLSLMGNHDAAWLEFLDQPDFDSLFVTHGGDKTAESYGVDADFTTQNGRLAARDALLTAMPEAHFAFLRALPLSVSFGDYFFCHAGIRPGVPLDKQNPHDLIWIREPFLSERALHPRIIVHGHTPVDTPEVRPNRINIDTGAVKTGVLTAVVFEGTSQRFIDVRQ